MHADEMLRDHNSANVSYLNTVGSIRERLQNLNAAMQARNTRRPTKTGLTVSETTATSTPSATGESEVGELAHEPPPPPRTAGRDSFADATQYDPQMSRGDKVLLTRGQATLDNSFSFRASTQTFGQHWETMNRKQRSTHLEEYIRTKYGDSPHIHDIRVFLTSEILDKSRGDKHVVWNGYFIEQITELNVPCSTSPLLAEPDEYVEGGGVPAHLANNHSNPVLQRKPPVIRFAKRCTSATQSAGFFEHVENARDGGSTSASHTTPKATNTPAKPPSHGRRASKPAACAASRSSNSFGAMRSRLRRERQAFYVLDNSDFE